MSDSATCCPNVHSHFPLPQVLSQTEAYLQQLLSRAVAVLPQWKVRVQKCKAVQMVLNLCSSSVTDKCLIAEAWCPTAKLPELQSALREGGVCQQKAAQMWSCRIEVIMNPTCLFLFICLTSGKVAARLILSTTGWQPLRLHPRCFLSTLSQLGFRTLLMLMVWQTTVKLIQVGLWTSKKYIICPLLYLTWPVPVWTPPQRCTP